MKTATLVLSLALVFTVASALFAQTGAPSNNAPANIRAPISTPTTAPAVFKPRLLVWSNRLIELQRTTPNDNINTIIRENHLEDTDALGKLDENQSRKVLIKVALSLYQASSKSDPLAAKLMNEFQITYTPKPSIYSLSSDQNSPNHEYGFVVVKSGGTGVKTFAYGLVRLGTTKVLSEIPCGYLVEGQDDSWALQRAQAAKVYWNTDGTRFVLDEENYRLMGKATLGIISANSITIHTFVPGDVKLRGAAQQWRIQVEKGWISPWLISMKIIGVSNSTVASPDNQFTQNFTCEVVDATHYRFFNKE